MHHVQKPPAFDARHHPGMRVPSPQADPSILQPLFCHTRQDVTSVAQSHSLQLGKAWSPGTPAAVLVNRAVAGHFWSAASLLSRAGNGSGGALRGRVRMLYLSLESQA